MRLALISASALAVAGVAQFAGAAITITQGASAPTYSSTLTFDEPGGATGSNVPGNSWVAGGVSLLVSGEGSNFVGDLASVPGYGWAGGSNTFSAPFGAFITLDADATAFSVQYFDSSGPPSFMGGGAAVVLLDDGVEVGSVFGIDPAWGGFGDSWFNIVADGGMKFDEVRLVGLGFPADAIIDNLSWNSVPAPSTGALMTLASLGLLRRRRA